VWELIPAITAQVVPSAQVAENVKIVDVLPPYTTYSSACTAALGGTILPALVEPNTGKTGPQAGYTRLTYFLGNVPANDPVPRIKICTDTDSLAPNGTSVENYSELTADADITNIAQRSDLHAIVLEQNGSMQIGKAVDRRLDPLNDDQVYRVEYANFATAFPLSPPTMIDVLPWNGDGLGGVNERTPESDFDGTVTLGAAPTVTFKDGSVPGGGDPFASIGTFTYSADNPSTINYDPDNNTSTWCLASAFGSPGCPTGFGSATASKITAFKFVSNYALDLDGTPRQGHKIEFALQADSNGASNRYTNRATVDTPSLPAAQFLRSNNVTVEVAGFNLGDVVFGDVNRNGRYDPAADVTAPAGVAVQVFRSGWPLPIATTTTNAAGRYVFRDLGGGDYYVVIPGTEFGPGGLLEDWALQPLGFEADPNTDQNESVDHHGSGVLPLSALGGVRTGVATLSATVPASPLQQPTGDEPLGDNVAGLTLPVGDDFTNLTLDIGLIPPALPAVSLVKKTNGQDANSAPGPFIAVGQPVTWTYEISNPGTTELVDVQVVDDNGTPSTPGDDINAVYLSGDTDVDNILDTSETWIFRATGTATEGQYENNATVTADPSDRTGVPLPGFGDVTDDDPSHYWGATAGINVVKRVQTSFDANTAPGPRVGVGNSVTWSYEVMNTGNTPLANVTVTDDQLGLIAACNRASLPAGDSFTCTASGTATAGQYENTGTATGQPVDDLGTPVPSLSAPTDDDKAFYFGAAPAVDIEKFVQTTFDADSATGPLVAQGGAVRFTYVITNTGNVALSDISVSDNLEGSVSCPVTTLAVGANMTCELLTTASASGQYTNIGSVQATGPTTVDTNGDSVSGSVVNDLDTANYFTSVPAIDVEKFVQTTFDADTPATGPAIADGSPVRFTYVITNTGNVALNTVALTDDVIGSITCPATSLAVGVQMTCSSDEVAASGTYTNLGTVTAQGPDTVDTAGNSVPGSGVSDSDQANYFGVRPGIDIEKSVQTSFDADTIVSAPTIAAGDTVNWTYSVVNTGNVALTGVVVTDDQLADDSVIDCGGGTNNLIAVLAVGAAVTCQAQGTAIASGTYVNIGSTSGTGPTTVDAAGDTVPGASVADTDPAYYIVSPPRIDIETTVQGLFDADTADGPPVPPGGDVLITYSVTNPGAVPILSVAVADSEYGTPVYVSGDTDGDNQLDPGETWIYTLTTIAPATGVHGATGTVNGVGANTIGATGATKPGIGVTDADDHYFTSSVPGIHLETTVQTLFDADVANGPLVAPASNVLLTYTVTNTGPVGLSNVSVADNENGAPSYVSGDTDGDSILDTDEVWIYTHTVTSPSSGVMGAIGTATGTGLPSVDSNGQPVPAPTVTDTDSHFYEVAVPVIHLETSVQTTFDADDPASGPLVAPGSSVLLTYTLTNPGNTGIANVSVSDPTHGTPTYSSGDVDGDGILDVGETWVYTLTVTAPPSGTLTATGSVSGTGVPTVGTTGLAVPGAPVSASDPHSFQISEPSIGVKKFVQSTFDAELPSTGPAVAASGKVTFKYVITNTGNVELSNVGLTDSVIGRVSCPGSSLLVGASMTCEVTVQATAGNYTNTGTATGSGPITYDAFGLPVTGAQVTASDLGHYFGNNPKIAVVKKVNGFDANDAPGLLVDAGADLAFTYEVTNIGNVDLSAVSVSDDRGVAVTCPRTTLGVNTAMTCTGSAKAPTAGQYTNLATASGTGPSTIGKNGESVPGESTTATDKANAFVPAPAISVAKFIVANGTEYDANSGDGPRLPAGSTATWRIKVTNTGNVDLADVQVIDLLATVSCPAGSTVIPLLAVGATVLCSATSTVPDTGTVTNTASATGTPKVEPLAGQPAVVMPISVLDDDVAGLVVVAKAPTSLAFTGGSLGALLVAASLAIAVGLRLSRRSRRAGR
jgi:uncharacterized repeat protein (TIGR01451 family)